MNPTVTPLLPPGIAPPTARLGPLLVRLRGGKCGERVPDRFRPLVQTNFIIVNC